MIEHKIINDWGDHYIFMEEHGIETCSIYLYNDSPNKAYICSLNIIEKERKKGRGTKLLNLIFEKCKELGITYCYLDCLKNNWVYNWYKKLGFQLVYEDIDEFDHEIVCLKKKL